VDYAPSKYGSRGKNGVFERKLRIWAVGEVDLRFLHPQLRFLAFPSFASGLPRNLGPALG